MNIFIEGSEYDKILRRLSAQIIEHEDMSNTILIGIQSRGDIFAKRIKNIIKEVANIDMPIGTININMYRDDLSIRHEIPKVESSDIPFDISNKNILLIDDVLYTGRTIRSAMDMLFDYGRAKSIQLVIFVDRSGRELPIEAKYVGKKLVIRGNEYVKVRINEKDGEEFVTISEN